MKRLWYVFLFIVLAGSTTYAQPEKSSLLWEVSGNGLQQPSWLFGTFHILCKEDFTISDILKNKLQASKQFYGELDMDDPNLQMQIAMKMMMTDKTLESLMTEDDYKKVSGHFQQITGMSIKLFNNFKPFMPLSLLAINTIPCDNKIQPETEFTELAKKNNLPIFGLETVDDQINAIDKEPLYSQINEFKQTVMNFDSVKQVMSQLISVYKLRDVDSLYKFMKTAGANDSFEMDLIINRNRNWIPVIKKALTEKPTFFAVGAGHLGGPNGVISLLRKQGYRVTPVMY